MTNQPSVSDMIAKHQGMQLVDYLAAVVAAHASPDVSLLSREAVKIVRRLQAGGVAALAPAAPAPTVLGPTRARRYRSVSAALKCPCIECRRGNESSCLRDR